MLRHSFEVVCDCGYCNEATRVSSEANAERDLPLAWVTLVSQNGRTKSRRHFRGINHLKAWINSQDMEAIATTAFRAERGLMPTMDTAGG